jgi:hypothetical protein
MAVRTNHVALGNFSQDLLFAEMVYHRGYAVALLTTNVVEVHDIGRVLNAAICTRLLLCLPDELAMFSGPLPLVLSPCSILECFVLVRHLGSMPEPWRAVFCLELDSLLFFGG